ncbi:MAG: DHH family phosphoesterase [bacterium]
MVEPSSASTTSIIFRLLKALKVNITKPIAELLYVGHLVDTGRFAFQNTTAQTLAEAAELAAAGANPYRLNALLFSSHSITHLKLLGRALENLTLDEEAGIAWSRITRHDLDAAHADASDFEGIPEFLLTTADADIAILFGENHADDRIRISFRSRDTIDISKVAVVLGGGGHRNASGAQVRGSLSSVIAHVVETTGRMRAEIS